MEGTENKLEILVKSHSFFINFNFSKLNFKIQVEFAVQNAWKSAIFYICSFPIQILIELVGFFRIDKLKIQLVLFIDQCLEFYNF